MMPCHEHRDKRGGYFSVVFTALFIVPSFEAKHVAALFKDLRLGGLPSSHWLTAARLAHPSTRFGTPIHTFGVAHL